MAKTEPVWVASTQDLRDAFNAGFSLQQILIPDLQAECQKSRDEGFEAGSAEGYQRGRSEGVSSEAGKLDSAIAESIRVAERERIIGIQTLTEPGFSNTAQRAINEGATLEAFAVMLLSDKRDRGITLEKMRNDSPQPATHGGLGDGTGSSAHTSGQRMQASNKATSIFASRRAAAGAKD